ncbi:MAG: RluA family pseudouridine synthase [Lachnospiraceae bacterium]|nr:RluA family pseudouridine synthase [Lachnospiraceae bacterium]
MFRRRIDYVITREYEGLKISAYLKQRGYPEKALTILRRVDGYLLIDNEAVHMNYRLFSETEKLTQTLSVLVEEQGEPSDIVPAGPDVDVVYEDDDILVVNKPAHMSIHPSIGHYEDTLANAVMNRCSLRGEEMVFRCINRLDRDTTGLTIIAKHYLAAGILSEAMRRREIKRVYTAVVEGVDLPDEGEIDLPIARVTDSVVLREVNLERGESALTFYRVVKRLPEKNLSVVELTLKTGRTHQIRVHMKALGHPLIGDFLYNPDNHVMDRQALHAGHIRFAQPITGEIMDFLVPLPKDIQRVLN